MTQPLWLDVLPSRLQLVSVERSAVRDMSHTLIRLCFFQPPSPTNSSSDPSTPDQRFFSVTMTPREFSFIVDTQLTSYFPAAATVCPTLWRCLEVSSGEEGGAVVDFINTVHTIAAPLAKEKISIFQVSTFDADYTLIPEDQLDRALTCLRPYFNIPRYETLIQNQLPQDFSSSVEEVKDPQVFEDLREEDHDLYFHRFSLPVGSLDLHVASARLTDMQHWMMRPLTESLLFRPDVSFLSLTVVEDLVSLVTDRILLNQLPHQLLNTLHMPEVCLLIKHNE